MGDVSEQTTGNRRIDRIRDQAFVDEIGTLSLDDLRGRRDECLAEREYLSLLRRLVQGRAEILRAELDARGSGTITAPWSTGSRRPCGRRAADPLAGEAVKIGVPEEEMLLARRRIERLVTDAGISDPTVLDDANLASAVELLAAEEREVSGARSDVIRVLDTLQDELKRRYREDPTLVLS